MPKWGIKCATARAVQKHGEHADDADIWVNCHLTVTYDTKEQAWAFCADEDIDSDGMLVHRPREIEDAED